MKKHLPIYLYGILIILSGIFLQFSHNDNFNFLKYTLGITLTIGAILAFIAAVYRQRKQVQFAYHEMHALAMLVYSISILLLCDSFDNLNAFTSFLLLFYAFSEIIFCNWLFNLGQKIIYKIVAIRLLLGLIIGVGTVVAMTLTGNPLSTFGILYILVGINILLYIPVMKGITRQSTGYKS